MADDPVLVITGASTGIGAATARRAVEFGYRVALVATALERFGQLDAFFANAGFGAKRGFLEETVEHWKSMIDTNVLGAALSIRASLPHFRERNAGHMILTSSIAGRRALPGSLYSATKHAVTAMGEALRQEI